jgi:peptidoglycan/xylan/chitin deacetylase (PgdA/CDA1 family)
MHIINTYKDFNSGQRIGTEIRNLARKVIIGGLSPTKNITNETDWIRFPYYHHVFDDERSGFERQLKYLKNFGEFISMDDACSMIRNKKPIDGRYFCLSFDDGFFNCYSNMMNITAGLNIPVIIYLPTDFIGLKISKAGDQEKILRFYAYEQKLVPFLDWEDCRKMLGHKITFGSHTCSHANLIKITDEEIEKELLLSKQKIEKNLGIDCNHFACPWGRPEIDFDPEKTSAIAIKTGYASFATTARGRMTNADDLLMLKRDHILANWENFQLKYFFSA